MVTRSLTLALALVVVISAHADLRFTPRESSYELEGIKLQQLAFSDGGANQITYQQPPGWTYAGSANKLVLHPPNQSQAEGSITKINLSKPGVFDETSMKELIQEALAAVPAESTNVALVSQEKNPVLIGRKETFLVIVSYVYFGEKYERSLMFLNRGNEQVRFQFVSRSANFKDLQSAFLSSQFSWANL